MGIFDFITKTQEATETLTKKLDAFANQSRSEQLETALKVLSRTKGKKKNASTKPDRSIEGISKQILEARDNIRRNGFSHYVYIANNDACDACKNLDGKSFPISRLKIGVNAPPMHAGCRCSIAAYSDREEYEKWLNSL